MDWCEKNFTTLKNSYDPNKAMANVGAIYDSDKYFDYAHFEKTADIVASMMEEAGLCEIEKLPLKADGHTRYGDWVIPRAWDIRRGELYIAGAQMDDELLCSYRKRPCAVVMYSQSTPNGVLFSTPNGALFSTPDGGVVADAIDIDAAKDPEQLDLKGKILLTGKKHSQWIRLALAKGALGIISDYFPLYPQVRETPEEMDGHSRWENDFIVPANKPGFFGFSLSPDEGRKLRALMEMHGGKVILRAVIEAKDYDGVNYTVSGLIPGDDQAEDAPCGDAPDGDAPTGDAPACEEVMLCGHLYEPGANDNATGCGALIELAATFNRLINEGAIRRPRRGIRVVLGFECAGQMGYAVSHLDRVARTVASINMDMVGAAAHDLSTLRLWYSPASNYSCMDLLLPALIKRWDAFTGTHTPYIDDTYSIADNLLADPMFGVPSISMCMHPAQSYHSSMDDMTRVDAGVLARNTITAGVLALLCADGRPPAAEAASDLMRAAPPSTVNTAPAQQSIHFENGASQYIQWLRQCGMQNSFGRIFGVSEKDSEWISESVSTPSFAIDGACAADEQQSAPIIQPPTGNMSGMIPRRLVKGALTLGGRYEPGEDIPFNPFYNYEHNCPIYWTDGKRTLGEIAALTAAELNNPDPEQLLGELARYYNILADMGYIEIR